MGNHISNELLEIVVYTVKPKLSAMSFELPKLSLKTSINNINWRLSVNHMKNLQSNVTPSLECRYRSCRSSYQNLFQILQSRKLFRDYLWITRKTFIRLPLAESRTKTHAIPSSRTKRVRKSPKMFASVGKFYKRAANRKKWGTTF